MSKPLVSYLTASTGNPLLTECLRSVYNQTHPNIQHLIFVDGPEHAQKVQLAVSDAGLTPRDGYRLDIVQLPYSVGKNRFNGHRMYGAGTYLCDGEFVGFLDDDNYIDPEHTESLLNTIQSGAPWAYSFRKITDKEKNVLCLDDCESLGRWPSVIHPEDYFIDVNCYFLPKILALQVSPIWYRQFREPGVMEVDRALITVLKQIAPNFNTSGLYTTSYTVGNSVNSVQGEFFIRGNAEMLRRHNGVLPWKK